MPVNLPTAKDVRKARKQATTAVAGALEQARTPLYAALGAGNLATETVVTYAKKARSEAYGQADTAQARVADLQARLTERQAALTDLPARLRTRLAELSEELTELRGKLEAPELREFADSYRKAVQELYDRLVARGERIYSELAAQPRVKKAVGRVGNAADTAEVRVEKLVEEASALADEVLGRVSRRTRSVGEKSARATQNAASDIAETVEDAGDEVASTTRSVTRKAANRTQPAKPAGAARPAARRTGTTTTRKA